MRKLRFFTEGNKEIKMVSDTWTVYGNKHTLGQTHLLSSLNSAIL